MLTLRSGDSAVVVAPEQGAGITGWMRGGTPMLRRALPSEADLRGADLEELKRLNRLGCQLDGLKDLQGAARVLRRRPPNATACWRTWPESTNTRGSATSRRWCSRRSIL